MLSSQQNNNKENWKAKCSSFSFASCTYFDIISIVGQIQHPSGYATCISSWRSPFRNANLTFKWWTFHPCWAARARINLTVSSLATSAKTSSKSTPCHYTYPLSFRHESWFMLDDIFFTILLQLKHPVQTDGFNDLLSLRRVLFFSMASSSLLMASCHIVPIVASW